ncbi:class I SAM-dependent methyltransferase [Bradymonadaceae bacterium TMQ3]|nr:class I SAM-dependent methyltransferase [Bradymonadaceae bacterium TMQ3]TXC75782.1 class I SAM-dependent methyltransferase [Bradymonadales bacterium TMQ1]
MSFTPLQARLYAATHTGTPGDLAYYATRTAGASSVLELGCGHGRLLDALGPGVQRLVGLDQDPELLKLASARNLPHTELIERDLRDIPADGEFEHVILAYNGLYCLPDTPALRDTFEAVARALRPGGLFHLDVYPTEGLDEDAAEMDIPENVIVDDPSAPTTELEVDGVHYTIWEGSWWDAHERTFEVTFRYVRDDEDGENPEAGVPITIAHRYWPLDTIVDAAQKAGLDFVGQREGFDEALDDELEAPPQHVLTFAKVG